MKTKKLVTQMEMQMLLMANALTRECEACLPSGRRMTFTFSSLACDFTVNAIRSIRNILQ